nr:MAG TPA: hypothetical protein [Caudoviricetes sp.]
MGRILCPLLVFENGQKPTFFGNIWPSVIFGWIFCPLFCNKSGQKPTFVLKVATKKPCIFNGLRVVWPNAHFYLLLA